MVKLRSRSVPIMILLLTLYILSSLIFTIPPVTQASPDEEIRSPSSESGNWLTPTNAYASDDSYASAFIRSAIHQYGDYGFSLSSVTIEQVFLGVEHFVSGPAYSVQTQMYDGSTWSGWSNQFTYTSEVMLWLNYTDVFDWNPTKVNNIAVQIRYLISGGGGCYPNNMYIVVTENPFVVDRKNDELLDFQEWDYKNPEEISKYLEQNKTLYALTWSEEEGWFVNEKSKVARVDKHHGTWMLYDVYSGEINISYTDPQTKKQENVLWTSHLELTDTHPRYYSLDGKNWILGTSKEMYEFWKKGKPVYINHLWYNYTLKSFEVKDVKIREFTGYVYNIWLEGDDGEEPILFKKGKTLTEEEYRTLDDFKSYGVPIGKFPPYLAVSEKTPYTAYLDWIPVKVIYSPGGEEEEWVDCQYIGMNNTIAGEPTLFSSEWSDINATEGLSHFRFCTNNTGTWVNDTWSSSWRDTVWADAEKTLNSTVGLTIAFRFYINNTEGTEYEGTICYFTSQEPPPSPTYTSSLIGVSSTLAGEPTLFSSSWEELYDGVGLSHWLCSTNNTGTWLNSSWSSSWAGSYWAEYELTLNSTEDLTIAFCFYVNDTAGDEWSSANCTFTTPVTRTYEGSFFGVTHRVDYGLTLLVVSPPHRSPSFQEFLYDKVEIPVELIILNREARARYFDLSYTVYSDSGELLKEGDLSLEIEPKAQQPVGFSFQVPYGKREAPKNFTVILQANGGEGSIELDLTLSHSWASFLYPLAFIGIVALVVAAGYVLLHRRKGEETPGRKA